MSTPVVQKTQDTKKRVGYEQDAGSMGCMLEMTFGGKNDIILEHGGTRKFLKDGDEVIMTAVCQVLSEYPLSVPQLKS